MTDERLRILLVDDHVLFRKGIAALLTARGNIQVVGEAGDGLAAVAMARELIPDIVLMDINMPGCSGLDAVPRIKSEVPTAAIVMLTVSDDNRDLFTAIKRGASGYLLKDLEPRQLFELLEGVGRGEAPIAGVLAARILDEFRQMEREPAAGDTRDNLTARELEVLKQVALGASNREIAATLSITENTVKIHLRNILEKLHLHNRIQAAAYAVRRGLAECGE